MTTKPPTKEDVLKQINDGRSSWETLLDDVGEERMEQPGATDDWTFKDVAAHLNAWRELTLARLEAAARGEAPAPPPWPAELEEGDPYDVSTEVATINAWFHQRDHDRPAAEVIAEAREQFQRMSATVTALSPEGLFTPGRFSWLGDHPLSAVIDGSLEHLAEHEEIVREWLNKTGSSNTQ